MKVSICEKCLHCERRGWSSYCKPNGYHPIGVPHTYRYCKKYFDRCHNVKQCELIQKGKCR